MHLVAIVLGVSAAPQLPTVVGAQIVLDHTLAHVNGHIITESDVRQARVLKLVADTTSDAAIQRALEDRTLILEEIARTATPLPPQTEAAFDARLREWQASLGGETRASGLLGDRTMSESGVEAWLRDDLRIRAYLARQFGSLPETDRTKTTSDWLGRLRQRAGLQ